MILTCNLCCCCWKFATNISVLEINLNVFAIGIQLSLMIPVLKSNLNKFNVKKGIIMPHQRLHKVRN